MSRVSAARSVSEILPRAFNELELADVEEIIARVGDSKETLFFERKEQVGSVAIAKSCAAFANTYGGLLMVGVVDKTDELVGIPTVAEPQVWVKDILRGNVLPLPAFQARWLSLNDDRGLLLVLVAESSTTPHLLMTNGAIYVRNPGSSDPVPIADQARLLDLSRRGKETRERAIVRAREVGPRDRFSPVTPFHLALAPTGYQADAVQILYLDARLRQYVADAVIDFDRADPGALARVDRPDAEWTQSRVAIARHIHRGFRFEPSELVEGLVVESDCAIALQHGFLGDRRGGQAEPRGPGPIELNRDLLPWFKDVLARGQDIVLALGGHGDLRVRFELGGAGRFIFFGDGQAEQARDDFSFEEWIPLDSDPEGHEVIAGQLRSALLRSLGVNPY